MRHHCLLGRFNSLLCIQQYNRYVLKLLRLPFWISAFLVVSAAHSQSFGDLPQNHWSRPALESLYGKFLVGRGDDAYQGISLVTRYEMAAALYRLVSLLSARVSGLSSEAGSVALPDYVERKKPLSGHDQLTPQLESLNLRIDSFELKSLKGLVAEFEKELSSLGVEVDVLQSDIQSLEKRLSALETRKNPLILKGEASIGLVGAVTSGGRLSLTSSGHTLGSRDGLSSSPFERNVLLLHEALLNVSGDAGSGVRFTGTFAAGNALPAFKGLTGESQGVLLDSGSDIHVEELHASWTRKVLRGSIEATFGRFGQSVPLIFEPNLNKDLWVQSELSPKGYLVDGLKTRLSWSGTDLDIFAGRVGATSSSQSVTIAAPVIRSFTTNVLPAEAVLGAGLDFQANSKVNFSGGFIYVEGANRIGVPPKSANRMITLGGAIKIAFPRGLHVEGGIAKNILKDDSITTVDNRNESFFASLGIPLGSAHVSLGYKRREHNSFVNGDWGRLGAVINPTGYTGLSSTLCVKTSFGELSASYEAAEGIDREFDRVGTAGLDRGDGLKAWSLEGAFRLGRSWTLSAAYSDAQWTLSKAADPRQSFLTIAIRTGGKESRTSFMLGLQASDVDSKGADFLKWQGMDGVFRGTAVFSKYSMRF